MKAKKVLVKMSKAPSSKAISFHNDDEVGGIAEKPSTSSTTC